MLKYVKRPLRPLVRFAEWAVWEARWRFCSARLIDGFIEQRLGTSQSRWLFLIGVNNSGTTLVSKILSAHRSIGSLPGEGQWLTNAFPTSYKYNVARVWSERDDVYHWTENDDAGPARRALYDWSRYLKPAPILLEKSPPNTLRTRWLKQCFPSSSFILLTRSPYAVAEGIRRREGYTIERAARHWVRTHEIFHEDAPHLDRLLHVRYEDFCSSPDQALSRIEEFLGIESGDRNVLKNEFSIHNMDGASSGIVDYNRRSLKQLSAEEIEMITKVAGPQMDRLGYERIEPSLANV